MSKNIGFIEEKGGLKRIFAKSSFVVSKEKIFIKKGTLGGLVKNVIIDDNSWIDEKSVVFNTKIKNSFIQSSTLKSSEFFSILDNSKIRGLKILVKKFFVHNTILEGTHFINLLQNINLKNSEIVDTKLLFSINDIKIENSIIKFSEIRSLKEIKNSDILRSNLDVISLNNSVVNSSKLYFNIEEINRSFISNINHDSGRVNSTIKSKIINSYFGFSTIKNILFLTLEDSFLKYSSIDSTQVSSKLVIKKSFIENSGFRVEEDSSIKNSILFESYFNFIKVKEIFDSIFISMRPNNKEVKTTIFNNFFVIGKGFNKECQEPTNLFLSEEEYKKLKKDKKYFHINEDFAVLKYESDEFALFSILEKKFIIFQSNEIYKLDQFPTNKNESALIKEFKEKLTTEAKLFVELQS